MNQEKAMLRIYYTIKKKRKLYFSNFLPIYLSMIYREKKITRSMEKNLNRSGRKWIRINGKKSFSKIYTWTNCKIL